MKAEKTASENAGGETDGKKFRLFVRYRDALAYARGGQVSMTGRTDFAYAAEYSELSEDALQDRYSVLLSGRRVPSEEYMAEHWKKVQQA